ncbi:carboxymuconolactone decarboxylase family protein [Agrobacterium vitis]
MTNPNEPEPQSITYEHFRQTSVAAHAALLAMGKAVDDSGLEKELTELVKLRVSQINGCAFCTQLHLNVARRIGVETQKLDLLVAWRDAGVYSARERAALLWAEQITTMATHRTTTDDYTALFRDFSEEEAINLTVAIANINAWNRIAGGLHFPPPAA